MVHDRRTKHRISVYNLQGHQGELPAQEILKDFGTVTARGRLSGLPLETPSLNVFNYEGGTYWAGFHNRLQSATEPVNPEDEMPENEVSDNPLFRRRPRR